MYNDYWWGWENTWHEIRDHSFIQNHSRSSDSQLLLFSSLIFYRVQVREHLTEIRDHSFIQNHSRSSDSQLLSSVHLTHLLQGSVREHLTRDQRPFLHPESLQIFRFTASPLQFTSLIFYRVQSENTWHEIRDHSFIQNHSRSSDSQLLLQFTHSSSTGFRSENTWHEIRDHSFIQNHSRSSDSQLFSSVHLTHLLQGSGQRTPDTRSETIPSSRITPDLQIHSFSSSVHLTHLLQGSVREHLTRDQRPFLHPESLQIFRFTASLFSSPHSSSTGFRSENTWHEIRDHSFIQNHSRSSDSQLLLFSSLTHLLQGSVREHLTRDQRPFLHPESLQIFRFTASSLQFTSLIFYRVQVREHLTRDQRPFLHPESLQIFRFTASSLQFTHSSSTGFRSENTWHEIRDHSFIQNHSRSSDSQLLSSVHLTHLLQGSGQRTPDTRSETIPSSRITPDLQIHSFFSSVHSLIFYRVQVREHLTRDQRPFLHPESLQIFRFTASSLQFTHSSSTGFRSENTWHEIRDHSFIQNHSRSSDSQLLHNTNQTQLRH